MAANDPWTFIANVTDSNGQPVENCNYYLTLTGTAVPQNPNGLTSPPNISPGFCAPRHGPMVGTDTTWDIRTPDLCATGHALDPDLIEYIDGLVVAYCTACRARVMLVRLPGATSMLMVKALLGTVMGLDEESAQTPDFNIGELLGLFTTCREALEEDERAIRQARKMIDLAGDVLNQKVVKQGI